MKTLALIALLILLSLTSCRVWRAIRQFDPIQGHELIYPASVQSPIP